MNTPPATFLALASGKGGTGKSTLALALAHVLGAAGPVALLDLDPQAGATDFAGSDPVSDPLTAAPVPVHGVQLYRGGRSLAYASVPQMTAHVARAIAGPDGPLVVADLSPAWGDVSHRVILSVPATLVLLAVKLDGGGIKAAGELASLATDRGLPWLIVPTFGKRWALASTVLASLRGFYGEHVTTTVIPEDVRAAEAVPAGQPVTRYAHRSRVAAAVRELAAELSPLITPLFMPAAGVTHG